MISVELTGRGTQEEVSLAQLSGDDGKRDGASVKGGQSRFLYPFGTERTF